MKTYKELLIEVQKSLVSAQFLECARQNGYKFTKLLASAHDKVFYTEQDEPVERSKTKCYLVYEFDEEEVSRLLRLLKSPTQERINSPEWEEVRPINGAAFDTYLLNRLFFPRWKKASHLTILTQW